MNSLDFKTVIDIMNQQVPLQTKLVAALMTMSTISSNRHSFKVKKMSLKLTVASGYVCFGVYVSFGYKCPMTFAARIVTNVY